MGREGGREGWGSGGYLLVRAGAELSSRSMEGGEGGEAGLRTDVEGEGEKDERVPEYLVRVERIKVAGRRELSVKEWWNGLRLEGEEKRRRVVKFE